tara:strand:+ start:791 stop:1129 length:339 start_codon:yes stop_codon:yes gene_type:complete
MQVMHGEHKYSFGTGFFDQAAGAKLDSQDILVQFLLNSLQKDTFGVNTQETLSVPPTQPTPSGHMVLVQVPNLAPSGSDLFVSLEPLRASVLVMTLQKSTFSSKQILTEARV